MIIVPNKNDEVNVIEFYPIVSGIDSYGIYYSDIIFTKNITLIGMDNDSGVYYIGDHLSNKITVLKCLDGHFKPTPIKKDNVFRIVSMKKLNKIKLYFY